MRDGSVGQRRNTCAVDRLFPLTTPFGSGTQEIEHLGDVAAEARGRRRGLRIEISLIEQPEHATLLAPAGVAWLTARVKNRITRPLLSMSVTAPNAPRSTGSISVSNVTAIDRYSRVGETTRRICRVAHDDRLV